MLGYCREPVFCEYPIWIVEPFSHIDVFPFNWRLDEVGMFAFAVVAVGFFVWQLETGTKSK
jgi:hypothetical protein